MPIDVDDDYPGSLDDPDVRQRRRDKLSEPHMAPLVDYVGKLRRVGEGEVPDFDPFDGGAEAQALFLFEKPGPKTSEAGGGSGFISRNNNDPSAKSTWKFMGDAGIPRELTVTWNVIPWWNGTIKVDSAELKRGIACIKQLIECLPKLRVVVFVGTKAQKAASALRNSELDLFDSFHPSARVEASYPEKWKAIPSEWAKIKTKLDLGPRTPPMSETHQPEPPDT